MIESKRLRVIEKFECALCFDEVEVCDECGESPSAESTQEWCCYNDGDLHYCQHCWDRLNPERKRKKDGD